MRIAGVEIGPDQPCRVVCEISNNHNGDRGRAVRLIEACAAVGADFVKFQCYTPDELVALRGDGPAPDPWGSEGWTMRRLYEKARTPLAWFPDLIAACDGAGIPWFSSVFGPESVRLMMDLGCPAYKVAALDVGNRDLMRAVQQAAVVTGAAIVASVRSAGAGRRAADLVLHCPPGYPQDEDEIDESGLGLGWYDGFSYHGTDPRVPARMALAGANVLECHVQLVDEPSELEAGVSLTMAQLRDLVLVLRLAGR